MVAVPTESTYLADRSRSHASLYAQVDLHFDHSYFARLLMNGIVQELDLALMQGPLFPESDGENHVLHVQSFKLTLYEQQGEYIFGVQVMTASGPGGTGKCIAAHFFHGHDDNVTVEYTIVTEFHGPKRFRMQVPRTSHHPLNIKMAALRWKMVEAFRNGQPNNDALNALRSAI